MNNHFLKLVTIHVNEVIVVTDRWRCIKNYPTEHTIFLRLEELHHLDCSSIISKQKQSTFFTLCLLSFTFLSKINKQINKHTLRIAEISSIPGGGVCNSSSSLRSSNYGNVIDKRNTCHVTNKELNGQEKKQILVIISPEIDRHCSLYSAVQNF